MPTVSLIEVLPKEKKQKEEKVQLLGQATFDLLPIVKGESRVALRLTIYPVPGSFLELQQQQQPESPLVCVKTITKIFYYLFFV